MNYNDFFIQAPRFSGKKSIALVKGDKFAEFVSQIALDNSLEADYRAFVICCISGGLRVEEALGLTPNSFKEIDGNLFFQSKVLKKRRKDQRWCRVHPNGQGLVLNVVRNKIGTLFDWTQGTALNRAKRTFQIEGMCSHSFRHSAVSYYLFTENLSKEKTAKLVHVSTKIVDVYAHLDERLVLKKMFNL